MTKYIVRQSGPLRGEVTISGAKNAVLPLMAATLLNDQECVIRSVPHLRDVQVMKEILESLGSEIEETEQGEFHIHTHDVKSAEAPYELVNNAAWRMRHRSKTHRSSSQGLQGTWR